MGKLLLGFLLLVAGVVAGWYFFGGGMGYISPPGTQKMETTSGASGTMGADDTFQASGAGEQTEKGGGAARTVVTYTDTGFAPSPVTVKKGEVVTFVNESTGTMWVASGEHPTHQLLPGFDQLEGALKGGTYEYTFMKVGTWKYHNHNNDAHTGFVKVTE